MRSAVPRARSLLPLALLAAAAVACPGPDRRDEGERPRSYEPSGKTLVVVLDASSSMEQNDPDGLSIEGAQLAAALAERGDNVACIRFGSDAGTIAPLRTLRTPDDRRAFCDEVADVRRRGRTNFIASLARARAILEHVGAPAGSTAIFMTDGEHNTGGASEDVLAQVAAFRARGWRIDALGYGAEARSDLLSNLATQTGGGLFHAAAPKELLLAYLEIVGGLEDFLIAPRIRPARLLPGTSRLLYVILKGSPETRLAAVTRDGAPVPLAGPATYHYPGAGERSKAFEVLRIEDPAPGLWDAAVAGPYEVGFILQKAPFTFSFAPGAPDREQVDGRPVRLVLVVEGEGVEGIAPGSGAEATVTALDGRTVARLALAPDLPPPGRPALAFAGEFTPRLEDPAAPEVHTAAVRFTYRDGEAVWVHRKKVSYRLVPPPPATLAAAPPVPELKGLPERFAFSATSRGWTPEAEHEASLEYGEACDVSAAPTDLAPAGGKGRAVRANDEFEVALDGLTEGRLAPGRSARLRARVYVPADLRPGSYAGKVAVTVRPPGGRGTTREVPVELTVTR